MRVDALNIDEKFAGMDEPWRPRIAAQANGQDLRIVYAKGVFPWHRHDEADELFLVWTGRLDVEFRDRVVSLGPGELCVVPRGTEHRTVSEGAQVLIFEPSDVVNTGDAPQSDFTAPGGVLA